MREGKWICFRAFAGLYLCASMPFSLPCHAYIVESTASSSRSSSGLHSIPLDLTKMSEVKSLEGS